MPPIDDISKGKRQEVKEILEGFGLSISQWARDNGYRPELVYGVLSGRIEGKRGLAHRIAIDLGLKTTPDPALSLAKLLTRRSACSPAAGGGLTP